MYDLDLDWLTSDLHLEHENIVKWRSFDGTARDMTEHVIAIWNDHVGPDDRVGVLGDILMGPRLEGLPLIDRLYGRKYLLPGNHDHCWNGNRRRITEARSWPELYGRHVEIIEDGVYRITGLPQPVHMSHFPYYGDHTDEDRYVQYRPDDNGLWLLHGHVHGLWRINGRMINLGMDAWGKPVHVSEVASIMEDDLTFIPAPLPNPLSNTIQGGSR